MGISNQVAEAMSIFDEARSWTDHGLFSRIKLNKLENRLLEAWDTMIDRHWLVMTPTHWTSIDNSLALFQAFTVDPVDFQLKQGNAVELGSMLDRKHCLSSNLGMANEVIDVLFDQVSEEASKLLDVSNPAIDDRFWVLQNKRAHVTAAILVARSPVKEKQLKHHLKEFFNGKKSHKIMDDLVESLIAHSFNSWPSIEPLDNELETTIIDFCLETGKYKESHKMVRIALEALYSTEYVRAKVNADLNRAITYCKNWDDSFYTEGLTPPRTLLMKATDSIIRDLRSGNVSGNQSSAGNRSIEKMKAIEDSLAYC